MKPYYDDGQVCLYLGDCREVTDWLAADVLVTDPPYGRKWRSGSGMTNSHGRGRGSVAHGGIAGDDDTTTRDEVLAMWGGRLAMVFGDPLIARPAGTVQVLGYAKPIDAGVKGARAGFRRDLEEIYLVGSWPAGTGGRSSILRTGGLVAGPRGIGTRNGHPHAKPVDVMETLIAACPPGVIADPFAGGGRNAGGRAQSRPPRHRRRARGAALRADRAATVPDGAGGIVRSVATRTLLGQPGSLQDPVHLRLPVGNARRDVLDERAFLPLGDDGGGQFLAGRLELVPEAGIGTRRLRQARLGLGAHRHHDDTASWRFQYIHGGGLRYSLT